MISDEYLQRILVDSSLRDRLQVWFQLFLKKNKINCLLDAVAVDEKKPSVKRKKMFLM